MTLLDALMYFAGGMQVWNLWHVAHLRIPAVGFFVAYATFVVVEIWLAIQGLPGMYLWAAVSAYSLLMSTKAIHGKYFEGRFDVPPA